MKLNDKSGVFNHEIYKVSSDQRAVPFVHYTVSMPPDHFTNNS